MLDVVTSIYDMMGRCATPSIDEYTAKDHVEMVFQRMDANKDGVISVEEFMDTCRKVNSWKSRGGGIIPSILPLS